MTKDERSQVEQTARKEWAGMSPIEKDAVAIIFRSKEDRRRSGELQLAIPKSGKLYDPGLGFGCLELPISPVRFCEVPSR